MAYQPPPDGSVPPGGASPPGGAFGAAPHVYGPSNPYSQPNAYGPPGAYGLAAYPQQGGGAAFASAASAAGSVVAFAGMSVGVAVFWRLLGLAGALRAIRPATFRLVSQGVNGLVHFVAIVLFLVWIHRLTTAIRAIQGSSAYSPGMAVGGWFIPLANFVLPYLTVRDAWKRTMPGDGRGAVVALWWASYLAAMVFSIIYGLPGLTQSLYHALGNGGLVALSWVYFLATVATWGSMLLFVRWITERTAGRPA